MRDLTLEVVEHPLIEHKLSFMRDRHTGHSRMRELVTEITLLMTFHATRGLEGEEVAFETPLEEMRARRIREDRLVVVPVLRAGLGMVEGVLRLVPGARVGHLGFYRDEETLQPVRYYAKLPPHPERHSFLLVDPMLGTGGTASASISDLKEQGVKEIAFICLVASPEGAARLTEDHPDVPVYAAALDRELNEKATSCRDLAMRVIGCSARFRGRPPCPPVTLDPWANGLRQPAGRVHFAVAPVSSDRLPLTGPIAQAVRAADS